MFDTSAAGHDLNVDNGTFVVDASANRVGIGTATPSTLLDVNGALTATTIAGTLTTAAQTNITSLGTLSTLAISGDLTVDTSTLKVDSSNNRVGIGNASPGFPLHVNSSGTDIAKFESSGSYTFTRFSSSSRNWALSIGSSFSIYDETGSQTLLALDSSGNLSLQGTAVIQPSGASLLPSLKLNNNGYLGSASTPTAIQIATGGDVVFGEKVGIGVSPNSLLELSSALTSAAGGVTVTNTNAAGYSTLQLRNTAGTAQTYTISVGGSGSAFAQKLYIYDDTDSTARLVIDHAGNIGIGANSPTEKLEVSGSINVTNQSTNFAAGAQRGFLDMVNASKHVRIGSLTGAATATGTQGTVEIIVNNSAKVVVDENGNVGIGDTDPATELVVKSSDDTQVQIVSGTNNDAYLSFLNGTIKHGFKQDNTGLFNLNYYGGGSTEERISVKTDGNIGINDTNPDRKVSIIGDSSTYGQYPLSLDATNTDYALEFRRSGTSEWWIKASASNFTVHENGVGDQFTVYSGSARVYGLLGVNKAANPSVGLSVGSDASTTSSYGLEVTNSSANTRFLVDGVGNSYFYKNDNNVGMKFDATNGRLGIGTGAGVVNYPLTVSGESSLGDFSANGFANLGRNADGNQDVTTLGGYGVDAGSGTRYGRYGVLRFRSSANYTSGSRGYMITNAYGANKFAILQSSSATTMPSIGSYGGVSGGTAPFIMDNSGDITMGYQPAAYGRITGNITSPGQDYGIALTTDYYRNITAQTNSTHGPGLTITRAGVYIMSMSFLYDPVGTYVYIGWCVNGSIIHHFHSNHAIANNHDGYSSIARYLNVGDHLTIERTTANAITTIYGNSHSYWWVCKVG